MQSSRFVTDCDSTLAALDLWSVAKPDPKSYIDKAAQRSRLRDKGLDDCIDFCLTMDYTEKIPVIQNDILVDNIL
jgi:2-phosphosulfolactate phosphatase